jgi:hypothetical protein
LYILGSGFTPIDSLVFIGTTECTHKDIVTSTRIVCETPELPVGSYQVRVLTSSGVWSKCTRNNLQDDCKLEIRDDYTPYLSEMLPVSMAPWTDINFKGHFYMEDERNIRFEIGEENWCNSTDFMQTWYRTHSRWGEAEENCTVL